MKISIIAPAHNEQDRIRPFLDSYCSYFKDHKENPVEIIVVVNNSSDGTEGVVRHYAEQFPFLKVILEPENVGKGGALLIGFDQADGDLVGFVDADGATPPSAFMDLISHIEEADVIIASRWMKGADVSPVQPTTRRIASRIFNVLVRIMFGMKLHDTQCGAKLMRGDSLKKIRPCVETTRWAFDVDLLFQFRRHGFKIVEYPTVWHDVTGSKVLVARASTEMMIAMCRLRMIYSPLRFLVKLYDISAGRMIDVRKIEVLGRE